MAIHKDIHAYNAAQSAADERICDTLAKAIDRHLGGAAAGKAASEENGGEEAAENKIWHRHPVWFLNGNPIVGYRKLKGGGGCIRLLFWSGQSFDKPALAPEGTFKA